MNTSRVLATLQGRHIGYSTVILDPNSHQKLRVNVDKQFLYPNHSVDLGPIPVLFLSRFLFGADDIDAVL